MIADEHILFNDAYLSIVNKPHGLQTEPDKNGHPDLCTELRRYLNKINRPPKILQTVNRLDRPVAGLVLFAKTSNALRLLNEMQINRAIKKTYTALIGGIIDPAEAVLAHYHVKDLLNMRAIIADKPLSNGKPCKLSYKTLSIGELGSRLEIDLHTGKYHQIRAQFSFMGHPIVGDVYYDSENVYADHAICLHASRLIFSHPITNQQISLSSVPQF